MRRRPLVIIVTVGLVHLACGGEIRENDLGRARAACAELGKNLKQELMAEIQKNSFTGAIAVCQTKAPELARATSEKMDLRIRRVSRRARNPDSLPVSWEREALEELEQRLSDGEGAGTIEYAREAEDEHGHREVRFAKPIVTAPLCLTCHGTQIDPVLKQEIRSRYPGDEATGYREGDLRGAFSVRIPLEQAQP